MSHRGKYNLHLPAQTRMFKPKLHLQNRILSSHATGGVAVIGAGFDSPSNARNDTLHLVPAVPGYARPWAHPSHCQGQTYMGGQDRDFGPFVQIIWRQVIGRPLLRDEVKENMYREITVD